MQHLSRPLFRTILALLSFLSSSFPASAAALRLESAGPPPEELAAVLRNDLVVEGVRASTGTTSLEIWLRKEPPLGEAKEGLGISFGRLTQGALAGAIRLTGGWTDYKGQKIGAGLYTLRYAIEPADGYHMGVSAYRDFFLLLPAADDPGPATVPKPEELYTLSNRASRTSHPAVLALFPIPRAEKATAATNEMGQPTVAVPFGELTLGLVVEGTGDM